jgi:hypothetical protein
MKKISITKLQFKKESVLELNKIQMSQIHGGQTLTQTGPKELFSQKCAN